MINENTVVLITNVSSGIGRTTACLLADYGFTVFGTSRNPNSIKPIVNVIIIKMDLTSKSSIKSGTVENATKKINNAPPALKVANQILKIIHSAEPNFRYSIDC